jgi:hypothetical protein
VSCCDAQAQNTGVIAYHADGSVAWTQPDSTKVHCGYEAPAIADPMGTGHPLILVGLTLLDGATGAIVKELDPGSSFGVKLTGFADVDGDGVLDVVAGTRAFRVDGTLIWDVSAQVPGGFHAVGDLDHDGIPEVAIISSSNHTAQIVHYENGQAKVIRQGIDINHGVSTATFCGAASEYGGGPPTIADFDGDGFPDIGVAGAVGYVVLSGKKLMDPATSNDDAVLWFKQTHDCSSAVTGSSVFDFNGDGKAEVLYSDEFHLWMYDGKTGDSLIPETCNTTGTLWEYPLVADVDNDGQADIVVVSNAYAETCNGTKQSGVRIFGSATGTWVRTRRVWNEHTYHVTNINEDGSVPAHEAPNYSQKGLDNYRQNVQPSGEFAAPDLVASLRVRCDAGYGLVATVRNVGEASAPAGVLVGFYDENGAMLGLGATSKVLYPAEAEVIALDLPDASPAIKNGTLGVHVVVDDGDMQHPWHECRVDNNKSATTLGVCKL